MQAQAVDAHTTLCFFLGFFFTLPGVFLAAFIGKERGAISALKGMGVSIIIAIMITVFAVMVC